MAFPREILNELRWHPERSLESAEITYEHRGAPGDLITISGREIEELGKSFFSTGGSRIPYHRIRNIRILDEDGSEVGVWDFPP